MGDHDESDDPPLTASECDADGQPGTMTYVLFGGGTVEIRDVPRDTASVRLAAFRSAWEAGRTPALTVELTPDDGPYMLLSGHAVAAVQWHGPTSANGKP